MRTLCVPNAFVFHEIQQKRAKAAKRILICLSASQVDSFVRVSVLTQSPLNESTQIRDTPYNFRSIVFVACGCLLECRVPPTLSSRNKFSQTDCHVAKRFIFESLPAAISSGNSHDRNCGFSIRGGFTKSSVGPNRRALDVAFPSEIQGFLTWTCTGLEPQPSVLPKCAPNPHHSKIFLRIFPPEIYIKIFRWA